MERSHFNLLHFELRYFEFKVSKKVEVKIDYTYICNMCL